MSFTSKRSNVVALSSAEAEYIAAVAACKELTVVRNVLTDLGFTVKGCATTDESYCCMRILFSNTRNMVR